MNGDEYRSLAPSARPVNRASLPPGRARDLNDAVYQLYALADRPALDALAKVIAADDTLPGSPGKDVIKRIIAGVELASQQDTVTVTVALARAAGHDGAAGSAERVRRLWLAACTASPPAVPRRPGSPIAGCDPLELEVHRSITLPGRQAALPLLPPYVIRPHDAELDRAAEPAAGGTSRMITLVGGSSTGKTRACWELVQRLEARRPGYWRLWHPYDPTRPEAAATALDQAGPGTILWLNEAQLYLAPPDSRLGERIAAGLRTLLADSSRGPVLVLATLWPEHWTTLTSRPAPYGSDPHAQARELLAGTDIDVPAMFLPVDLARLRHSADPRLLHAARHSDEARITQYLAGAPALLQRYRKASPAARALVDVAVDARRFGHPPALPRSFLYRAAGGYLGDDDWDALSDNWLEEALAYTAQPCNGTRGPLTRIRARPGQHLPEPMYRLADYLEQTCRIARAGVFPPASFWEAATATITSTGALRAFSNAALNRGRLRRTVALLRCAADNNDTEALSDLAGIRELAGDQDGATAAAYEAAAQGDLDALRNLAWRRENAGQVDSAATLRREATDRGDAETIRLLADRCETGGDFDGALAYLRKLVDHNDVDTLTEIAGFHARRGDWDGATVLLLEASRHGNTGALEQLALTLEVIGDLSGAAAAALDLAESGKTFVLRHLAILREQAGDHDSAAVLLQQAAALGDIGALRILIRRLGEAGDRDGAVVLSRRAADHGDTALMRQVARSLKGVDLAGAEALLREAVERGDTEALRDLAVLREQHGDREGAEETAAEAASRGDTSVCESLAWQRKETGDIEGIAVLLDRIMKVIRAAEPDNPRDGLPLAVLYRWAGDPHTADNLVRQAAADGHRGALAELVELCERAGDTEGANAAAIEAVGLGLDYPLGNLIRIREDADDRGGAIALLHAATNRVVSGVLQVIDAGQIFQDLAALHERAGDLDTATGLLLEAANRGGPSALNELARLHELGDDAAGAELIRRFGLDDDGGPANSLG